MPAAVAIWVWFCAYLNCAGWTLSALHQLNAGGYLVALAIWLAAVVFWKSRAKIARESKVENFCLRQLAVKLLRRFRRPFPLAFLILSVLAFVGGAIYAPGNYDALAYRVPRILHWLAAGQWHWIHTIFSRVNDRSCGIEWVSAPFIAIFQTDRPLFLINFISFLFLPGLVFSVFTRLGVRRRVAWHWMWLVPTAYGLILQAGSIGNDLFGATFALAAVDFALRAKISNSPRDFFVSLLAAAMMTSAKTSNLPLLLPWAIAIFPSLKIFFRRPLAAAAVCALAVFASVLPTVAMNIKLLGNWSGDTLGGGNVRHAVLWRTGANVVLLTLENFVPPVFPPADKWNRAMDEKIPPPVAERLDQLIEAPGNRLHLEQMQIEENSGFGFGVSILLLASTAAAGILGRGKTSAGGSNWQACVRWSPAISLFAILTQSNLSAIARLFTPYYPLLLPLALVGVGHEWLVRKRWWRAAAFAVFFMAAGLLVISPARPLFPVLTLLKKMSNAPARVREVYSVYRTRPDAFAPALAALPQGINVLGLATFDDPETSLWQPFGSRRIVHVCPGDTPEYLKSRGVEYILVKDEMFGKWFPDSFDDWLRTMNAQIVREIPLDLRAAQGAENWRLVKLN